VVVLLVNKDLWRFLTANRGSWASLKHSFYLFALGWIPDQFFRKLSVLTTIKGETRT
jgi:hypothetical protein